jgi:hypothetical protein
MNGLRKCGIYTHWHVFQPQRRMKFCHSQVNEWLENWLKNPKTTCSPSYADYRPKINAVILLDMGHTRGELTQKE